MPGIKVPPRTMMEVFKSLPEGTLAELIDGTLFMSPAPTPGHQRIVVNLSFGLSKYLAEFKTGEVLLSPCDVFLDEFENAVQPDIIFVSNKNSKIVKTDAIHGTPDLLIEILSPSNSSHDLVRKKRLYEKFGVKEYWIINPETKESIGYSLIDETFSSLGSFTGKLPSVLLNQTIEF